MRSGGWYAVGSAQGPRRGEAQATGGGSDAGDNWPGEGSLGPPYSGSQNCEELKLGKSQHREGWEPKAEPKASLLQLRGNRATFLHRCASPTSAMLLWKNSTTARPRRLAMCWRDGQAGRCDGI